MWRCPRSSSGDLGTGAAPTGDGCSAYWRARLTAGPLPCYRCRRPVYVTQRWQVEHMVSRVHGGNVTAISNQWVSHGHCNESHGGKIGAARTNAGRTKTTRPVVVDLGPEAARGIRGWSP